MNRRVVVSLWSAVVLALLASEGAAVHERIERTFPVEPGCMLILDTYRGSIHVEEGDAAEVRVIVDIEIDARDEEQARRRRADLQFEIGATAGGVTIRGRNQRESRIHFVWDEENEIDLAYRVIVPRRCNANVSTINGSITVGSLVGQVAARVENGNIFLRRIEGSADVRAEFGDAIVSRCTGDLTARVLGGLIRVGTIGGRADLKNSSGDVEIMMAHGATKASAEAGDVVVGFPRDIGGPATLRAAGGNVRVRIDPAARCTIEASARWGRVRGKLPLTVTSGGFGERKLAGALNGGGALLRFRADGGSVTIEPGETLFELAGTNDD